MLNADRIVGINTASELSATVCPGHILDQDDCQVFPGRREKRVLLTIPKDPGARISARIGTEEAFRDK